MLGLLRRNIHCCPAEVKSIAYKSLVRVHPRLEYCNTVWYPHHKTHISSIEKIQKRAARFVTGNYNRETSSSSLVQKLGWKPLEDRRTRARLTTIFKETHGLIPNNIDRFTHKGCHQTRRLHGKFSYDETPTFSKDYLKYSLYPRTIPEWNLLPDCVKTAPTLTSLKQSCPAWTYVVWSKKLTSKCNCYCHKCP